MTIYKTIITVTVLSDTPLEFDSLVELGHEIDSGDSIGNVEVGPHMRILDKAVKDELLSLGNDGTFFDHLDEEEQQE